MNEPIATRRPHRLEAHGDVRIDPYFWMKDIEHPDTLPYLKQENAYTEWVMKDTGPLQESLYAELRARVKEDDASVPEPEGAFGYFTRFTQGGEYPVYCRQRLQEPASDEVLLDVNALAVSADFMRIGVCRNSPDHRFLCYSTDQDGSERYAMVVKDLETGECYPETIPGTYYGFVWLPDSTGFVYTMLNDFHRPTRVLLHRIGSDPGDDHLLYEEPDDRFSLGLERSLNGRRLFIRSTGNNAAEWHILDMTEELEAPPRLIQARRKEVEYDVEDAGDRLLIRHNAGSSSDFQISEAPVDSPNAENWVDWLPHEEGRLIQSITVYSEHAVIGERSDGLPQIRIIRLSDREEHCVAFDEAAYSVSAHRGREWQTRALRYTYHSMASPPAEFEYDMESRVRRLLKQTEVGGDFDPDRLVTHRILAPARDGRQIPVSILMERSTPRDGSAPVVLTAYGSYGSCQDAGFQASRLSLIHRGFVWAIAHVRGGRDMGQQWYDDGKLMAKQNTFNDFIDCSEGLVESGYTQSGRIAAMGGSAGGLLMGVIANARPDLYRAILAHVPFVDVVSTMQDDSLPLTTGEYNEWGNPDIEEFYRYMMAYSPYDNVKEQAYPHLLATAGLQDQRVTYWEPAKWTAKLRHERTNADMLLLRTKMEAGHAGASGRFDALRDTALEYAFVLKSFGMETTRNQQSG